MDCSAFQNSEIDALYSDGDARELDDASSAAMAEHAASCASCAARLDRLRGMRGLVLSAAVEALPSDFEARVMAAVDAGLASRAAGAAASAVGPAPANAAGASRHGAGGAGGGAKILRFMSRPSFAVAATFVLVLGGAALMITRGAMKARAPASAMDDTPAAVTAAAAASVASRDPLPAVSEGAASAQALNEPAAALALAPPPPAATPSPMETRVAAGTKTMAPQGGGGSATSAAKALYAAGRYGEALPKFEALKDDDPEAALYAARCIERMRGCAAAAPRFDEVAQSNAGTEIGSRAQLEAARCYQSTGNLVAARKRYEAVKSDANLSTEAARGLDTLDRAGPGTPGAAIHAAPKAAAPPAKH